MSDKPKLIVKFSKEIQERLTPEELNKATVGFEKAHLFRNIDRKQWEKFYMWAFGTIDFMGITKGELAKLWNERHSDIEVMPTEWDELNPFDFDRHLYEIQKTYFRDN